MEMDRPIKISIAMTTYNGEKYIRKQLGSILSQTRQPDEVMICDDGSTDQTADLVQRFIEANKLSSWHFSVNPHNLGYIENFRHAIAKTTGGIVFLCDQDDIWFPEKIAEMTRRFDEDPCVKVLNSGFQKIDENGEPIYSKLRIGRSNNNLITQKLKPKAVHPFGLNTIVWRNISPGCTLAFTQDVKEFYIEHNTGLCPHDWEINIFGAVLNGLYFLNEALTGYRIHSGNTIGLAELTLPERLLANASDQRIALAEQELLRADAYINAAWTSRLNDRQREVLSRFRRTARARFRAIRDHQIGYLMRFLLTHPKDYLKLRGPQGILNDFRAVLKANRP